MTAAVLIVIALLVWPRVHALWDGIGAARQVHLGAIARMRHAQATGARRARWQIAALVLLVLVVRAR